MILIFISISKVKIKIRLGNIVFWFYMPYCFSIYFKKIIFLIGGNKMLFWLWRLFSGHSGGGGGGAF